MSFHTALYIRGRLRVQRPKDLAVDLVKPYKINDRMVDQAFELKHGKSVKVFAMDKVSNGPFTDVSGYVQHWIMILMLS